MIEPDNKEHVCERCGECCIHGSPTLHLTDLRLFEDKTISLKDAYTLRKGELVYDNVGEELDYLRDEMIKVKETVNSKTCIFHQYAGSGCRIYETRPLQCVFFECWNPKKFVKTLSEEKLSRDDLFYRVPALREIIGTHEEKCSYKKLGELFEKTQGGSEEAVNEIIEILQYDTAIRPFINQKMNIPFESMALIFGRPLTSTLTMFGYSIKKDEEGIYCLTLDKASPQQD